MKHKFLKIFLPIILASLAVIGFLILKPVEGELKTISSDAELYSIYSGSKESNPWNDFLLHFITLPFSLITNSYSYGSCFNCEYDVYDYAPSSLKGANSEEGVVESADGTSTSRGDYSTTNIQVENVDEADIVKTDGEYVYSLSGTDVIITDVRDSSKPVISARITSPDNSAPEDIILSDDILTVISSENTSKSTSRYWNSYYSNRANTIVRIYDIKDRTNPRVEKSYKLNEPYYTSRRIDNQLYVIASGSLRADGEKVVLEYEEDYVVKTFPATSVRYLKDVRTRQLTLISSIDLDNLDSDISLDPFLLDISNAYVSEQAFYLLNEKYSYSGSEGDLWNDIGHVFGWGGIIGYFNYQYNYSRSSSYISGYETEIYKFDIEKSGKIAYTAKTKIAGSTINQYSLDEKDGHLRLALQDSNGSYIAVFDEKLNKLGESGHLAKDEKMYASRFVGDKAYLVTYRNTDPLFVIDLKDETNPKVLGELKIPGYSVYLRPYDENHLIGIGIDTQEETVRDINGRVVRTTAYITGMKLALFDVSDTKNPKEISKVKIGNSHTTSAILTNPKALLFSKEKELLAIPVNNYVDEYKIMINESDDISDYVSYIGGYKNYISEGYLVYNINLEDGITDKGSVIHKNSSLIRGAYIGNNLITVSENMLKINNLTDLKSISELELTNK